jgi:DNA-binding PadR family transcriptional regulator
MYGLEIVDESGGRLKRGTVYVTVARMQQKKLVEFADAASAVTDHLVQRRLYRATAYGLRVLELCVRFEKKLRWEFGR